MARRYEEYGNEVKMVVRYNCSATPAGYLCGEVYIPLYFPTMNHFRAKAENRLIQVQRAIVFAEYTLLSKEGADPPPAEIVFKVLDINGKTVEFQPVIIDQGETKRLAHDVTEYFAGTGTLASFGVYPVQVHVRAHREWWEIWRHPSAYTLRFSLKPAIAYLVG